MIFILFLLSIKLILKAYNFGFTLYFLLTWKMILLVWNCIRWPNYFFIESWNELFLILYFLECPSYYSISWYIFKNIVEEFKGYNSFLLFGVIIWALTLVAVGYCTLCCTIEIRMILKLLPSVTHLAINSLIAARVIIINHVFEIPIKACIRSIIITGGAPTIILEIMSIYTFGLIVFSEVEGTELCFVVEHIEISIILIIVN